MKPRSNEEWLAVLSTGGQPQADAIADLRAYLLRAARYTLARQPALALSAGDIDQLAEDCAQEALMAVLKHLGEFRRESQFTTWAYKFAVNIALNASRRETWKHVSLDELLERELPVALVHPTSAGADPRIAALQDEVWQALHEIIAQELTERQRQVFRAVVLDDVPLDEIARVWQTNRNAIYKLLHDARHKLKVGLANRGFDLAEMLETFSEAR